MPRRPDTKQRIIKAVTEIVAEGGLTEASTRAIAKRVEVSENTLYRHFENKDDLINQTYVSVIKSCTSFFSERDNPTLPASERIKTLIESVFLWKWDHENAFKMLLDLSSSQLEALKGTPDPFDLLSGIIREGQKKNEFRKDDVLWLSTFAIGMILRPLQMSAHGYLDAGSSEMIARITDEVLRLLK